MQYAACPDINIIIYILARNCIRKQYIESPLTDVELREQEIEIPAVETEEKFFDWSKQMDEKSTIQTEPAA